MSFPRRTAGVALMRLGAGVTGLGDAVLRPQAVRLLPAAERAGSEALVRRLVDLGGDVRVQLQLEDGREVWGRLGGEEAAVLELREGQILGIRLPAELRALPRAA